MAVPTGDSVLVTNETELVNALGDESVTKIVFTNDIDINQKLSINRPVEIDGGGFTLRVVADLGTNNSTKHAIGFQPSGLLSPDGARLTSLTVDSNNYAYGVQAYMGGTVTLTRVALTNSKGAGLTVNGSTLTVDELTTSGNAWGSINVDPGSGVTLPSELNLQSGTLDEPLQIWSDGEHVTGTAAVTVNAPSNWREITGTTAPLRVWSGPSTVTFEDGSGSIITTQAVPWGASATTPTTDPARTGYAFAGWSGYDSLTDGWMSPFKFWTSLPTTYSVSTSPIIMDGAAQTINADKSVTFSIETTSGYADSGMHWWKGRLGDLPDFVLPGTGSPFYVNMRFDDGDLGMYNGTCASGHFTETQILEGNAPHSNYSFGPLTIDGDTVFGVYNPEITPGGTYGPWTLADFREGKYPGITADTGVRLNVGICTMTGEEASTTVGAPEVLPFSFNTMRIYADTTITAMWSINSYTVTFKDWDGTVLETQAVDYNTAATAPTNPSRANYSFTGWDTAFDAITGDLTVTAEYAIDTYTVTFKDFDGTVLDTQDVDYNNAATAPEAPVRTGYTFTGWDKTFSNVTGDLTVTAQYTALPIMGAIHRFAGANRYETAKLAALRDFPNGAKTAILAFGGNFPDALSASALAGVNDAPILLTGTSSLSPDAAEAMNRLGVDFVYIVGGTSVISPAVEVSLKATFGEDSVVRLGGANRYETSRKIAEQVATDSPATPVGAFVVRGDDFADALSVSSISAQTGYPVLLTPSTSLDGYAAGYLAAAKVEDVYVVGGTSAVSDTVAKALIAYDADGKVDRWGGQNRYETGAVAIRTAMSSLGVKGDYVGIASGVNFPDALVGGAALGARQGILMLTAPTTLSAETAGVIRDIKGGVIEAQLLGGTVALSANIQTDLAAALK